jgi:hypothetical protein
MIRDLSETLSALLAPALTTADISFERPTDLFAPTQTTVNLFLYDVRENVELRNNEPVIRRLGTQSRKEPPPVRLDCGYLVTAWPVGGSDVALQEHRLLSDALRRLLRFPTIPSEFLRGSLVGQQPPLPTVTARPDGLSNPAEFWTAVGSRLRAALTLRATISVPAFDEVSEHLVLARATGFTPTDGPVEEQLVQIGGRILAPATAVRAQATLSSAANGLATLQNAADALLFRPGDIVFLQDGVTPTHTARAAILDISGTSVRLERPLDPPAFPAGSTLRIADLAPRQDRVRLDRVTGIEPGAELTFTQAGATDAAAVSVVDRATGSVRLERGLTRGFAMGAADPVVNVLYGVAGAAVEALQSRLKTTSRQNGRYTFVRIPQGVETLRVTAVGFQPLIAPGVQIFPPGNQNYDEVLTPI